jgi:thiosulfate dehydrogenase
MRNFLSGCLVGVLVCVGVLILLLSSGIWPIRATADPSPTEARLARFSLGRALKHYAAPRPNPVAPSEANLLAGLKLFEDNCAGCHGTGGGRSHWGSSNFYPRAPQFVFERPTMPDWQLFAVVKDGIRYTGMGGWDGEMPEDDMWKVVTFLTHLDSLPPSVEGKWRLREK